MDRKSHWRIALARRKRKARQLARWARRVSPNDCIDELAEMLAVVNRVFMKDLADGR